MAAAMIRSTVTGKLAQVCEGQILLAVPGSDYQLLLCVNGGFAAAEGQKVTGTIHARAQRVDVVGAGGRYVEPVSGRPRRVQGRMIGGDIAANTICVKAGPTLVCTLTDARQEVGDFEIGQMVSFDVEPGARFEPME